MKKKKSMKMPKAMKGKQPADMGKKTVKEKVEGRPHKVGTR